MIDRFRRRSLAAIVSATLSLTCAVPLLAEAEEEPRSVWTALNDWWVELSSPIGVWARSDRESTLGPASEGLTEHEPPDAVTSNADGGPDSTSDTAPFIDPDG